MFVLHPLWQQLMETVLLWTQCHRQMDPLGLSLYKSYPFQIHLLLLRLLTNFYPSHSPLKSDSLRSPSLGRFFSKMTECLDAGREVTWEMGAISRFTDFSAPLNGGEKSASSPGRFSSGEILQVPSDRRHCGFQNVWELRESDWFVNRSGNQTACHFSVILHVL